MPSQRDDKPRNQTVINVFRSIILSNRIISAVKCLYCHFQMIFEISRQQTHLNQCTAYINQSFNKSTALVQMMLLSAVKSLSIAMIKALH